MDRELSCPACQLVPIVKEDKQDGSACGSQTSLVIDHYLCSCVAIVTGDRHSADIPSSTRVVGIGVDERLGRRGAQHPDTNARFLFDVSFIDIAMSTYLSRQLVVNHYFFFQRSN